VVAGIQQIVRSADAALARVYLSFRPERNAVMSFIFHSLFRNEAEIAQNLIDPQQRTTVAQLREFIIYYLEHGYRFITPNELLNGLDKSGKYVLMSFDDGYYNNIHARPVLEELKVPATFFISTNNVQQNKCFWWDVVYRERAAQRRPHKHILAETQSFKHLRTKHIEAELMARFGPDALVPRGDIDRPFTPAELADFAKSPYVHLGNHTADHAVLTNYTREEVREQVEGAQAWLKELTGAAPEAIAYPNGNYSDTVVEVCEELGLKVGFTVCPKKISLPLRAKASNLLRLGRFGTHGDVPLLTQCETYRSDLLIYCALRSGYLRLTGAAR
jgi:peptidoglycan/xylan/chitin deacetylase (PgdA/CDA1 family)